MGLLIEGKHKSHKEQVWKKLRRSTERLKMIGITGIQIAKVLNSNAKTIVTCACEFVDCTQMLSWRKLMRNWLEQSSGDWKE